MSRDTPHHTNIALLVLRVVLGIIFFINGVQKLVGFSQAQTMLEDAGFPLVTMFTVLLIIAEILCGVALMVGWYTRVAAGVVGFIMIVALVAVTGTEGFQAAQGNLMMLAAAVALMMMGGGAFRIRLVRSAQTGHVMSSDPSSDPKKPSSSNQL